MKVKEAKMAVRKAIYVYLVFSGYHDTMWLQITKKQAYEVIRKHNIGIEIRTRDDGARVIIDRCTDSQYASTVTE